MDRAKNIASQQEAIRQLEGHNESLAEVAELALKGGDLHNYTKLLEAVAANNAQIERYKNLGDNWRVVK